MLEYIYRRRVMADKKSNTKVKAPDFPLRQGKIGRFAGAGDVTRTHDLLITNQLLYRLSYTSICGAALRFQGLCRAA